MIIYLSYFVVKLLHTETRARTSKRVWCVHWVKDQILTTRSPITTPWQLVTPGCLTVSLRPRGTDLLVSSPRKGPRNIMGTSDPSRRMMPPRSRTSRLSWPTRWSLVQREFTKEIKPTKYKRIPLVVKRIHPPIQTLCYSQHFDSHDLYDTFKWSRSSHVVLACRHSFQERIAYVCLDVLSQQTTASFFQARYPWLTPGPNYVILIMNLDYRQGWPISLVR